MSRGFDATYFQISLGYRHFRGERMPDNLSYIQAANDLVRDFGMERVKTVLTSIPNEPGKSDAECLAAAQQADALYQ